MIEPDLMLRHRSHPRHPCLVRSQADADDANDGDDMTDPDDGAASDDVAMVPDAEAATVCVLS